MQKITLENATLKMAGCAISVQTYPIEAYGILTVIVGGGNETVIDADIY